MKRPEAFVCDDATLGLGTVSMENASSETKGTIDDREVSSRMIRLSLDCSDLSTVSKSSPYFLPKKGTLSTTSLLQNADSFYLMFPRGDKTREYKWKEQ